MWGRLPFCFTRIHPCDVQMGWGEEERIWMLLAYVFARRRVRGYLSTLTPRKSSPFWCYCASQKKSEKGFAVITPNQLSRCGSLQIMCSWDDLLFVWIYLLQQKSKFLKYECLFKNATTVMRHIPILTTSSQFKPLFMLQHYIQSSASYIISCGLNFIKGWKLYLGT